MKRALLIFVLFATFARGVFAHEVRPAYLELRQTGPDTYDALWKVPGSGENLRLGLYVELPAGCTNVTEPRASMANNAFTERWTVKRAGGLTGGTDATRHESSSSRAMATARALDQREGMSSIARRTGKISSAWPLPRFDTTARIAFRLRAACVECSTT